MTTSNRLDITEMAETQEGRHITVNEAIAKLEAGACLFGAISVLDNAPPVSPAEGDIYVIGTSGSGAWSGQNEKVAVYYNAEWKFLPALPGMQAYAADEDAFYYHDVGGTWTLITSSSGLGDVVGPGSAVDSNIVLFNTTTGKLIKDGGVAISTDGTFAANSDAKLATEKATKTYVDGLALNLGKRSRVRVATTASVTISTALNNGDSLDGVTLATGDLVLVKNQSAAEQNGIYVVGASPARSSEFDTYDEHPGSLIAVEEGTAGADTLWLCTANAGGTLNTTAIAFSQFVVPAMASTTDVLTGTDTAKAVTADALAAIWEKGADVTSSGTISLGEGGFFHITGTTGITDIDWATAKDGRPAYLTFDGILTLTNSSTLKLPGGADITTAAGDRAIVVQDNGDTVLMIAYIRADGRALIPSVVGSPFEIEVAISDESTALTTGDNKIIFYAPMNATISEVFTGLSNQSSSGAVTCDLNKNGSTMFSTKPSIDASEDTSLTGTAAVLSTTTWTKGDKMAVDLDAAGTGAKGLKMIIRGTRL